MNKKLKLWVGVGSFILVEATAGVATALTQEKAQNQLNQFLSPNLIAEMGEEGSEYQPNRRGENDDSQKPPMMGDGEVREDGEMKTCPMSEDGQMKDCPMMEPGEGVENGDMTTPSMTEPDEGVEDGDMTTPSMTKPGEGVEDGDMTTPSMTKPDEGVEGGDMKTPSMTKPDEGGEGAEGGEG